MPVLASALSADPAVQAFGISLDTKMSAVDARVLNPPLLTYSQPQALTPGTRVCWATVVGSEAAWQQPPTLRTSRPACSLHAMPLSCTALHLPSNHHDHPGLLEPA
jgi:hypothetical protein